MSRFVLIHFEPEGNEERFELEDGRSYRLGALDDNDFVFGQQDVSRHHAILRVSGSEFHITDLKSKNGTFINGNRTEEAQFRAGDLISLSSAKMLIVDSGSDEFPLPGKDSGISSAGGGSDTVERRIRVSVGDLVELLEVTGSAVHTGAVAEPLSWAGRALGLTATLLLFSDDEGRVSIVSSAGDLGPLMTSSEALLDLVRGIWTDGGQTTRIRRLNGVDEDLLVAPVGEGHCLVVRYGGSAPAVGDIRALVASLRAVIGGSPDREDDSGCEDDLSSYGEVPAFDPTEELNRDRLRSMSFGDGRKLFERWFITGVLEECGGNQSEAARRLGFSRVGLFKKLKKLGL